LPLTRSGSDHKAVYYTGLENQQLPWQEFRCLEERPLEPNKTNQNEPKIGK
jgi:hypothetical protein